MILCQLATHSLIKVFVFNDLKLKSDKPNRFKLQTMHNRWAYDSDLRLIKPPKIYHHHSNRKLNENPQKYCINSTTAGYLEWGH